mgnify:CR=1 FL=1
MQIVIDAMGSDNHPVPELMAAHQLIIKDGKDVLLSGNLDTLKQKMNEIGIQIPLQNILAAPDIVEMADKPVESAKKKPRNSMAVGIEYIKNNKS